MDKETLQARLILESQRHVGFRCRLEPLLLDALDALEVGYPDVALDRIKSALLAIQADK